MLNILFRKRLLNAGYFFEDRQNLIMCVLM